MNALDRIKTIDLETDALIDEDSDIVFMLKAFYIMRQMAKKLDQTRAEEIDTHFEQRMAGDIFL